MLIYTIIPARGGSKSIPRKNIRELNGSPLIKYSIDYSLHSKYVDRTIVSTDDKEIASIAVNYGAEVPFMRPSIYAEDLTQDFSVLNDAMLQCQEIYNEFADIFVLLRPTSPLRPAGLIEKSIDLLVKNPEASSVRAVTKSSQHPYRQWKSSDKYIESFVESHEGAMTEPYNLPRQILPDVYFQTGDIEVVRRETLLSGSVSGKKILPIIIESDQVLDIDNLADLKDANNRLKF
ncbi:acylneuraminate cytidylyltransferase family protein [bacterium]|jgi:N-acylneuraminate cytidylyltransferase|nr:acylneuraminate cytidylyltransferase family protein [bacterium]